MASNSSGEWVGLLWVAFIVYLVASFGSKVVNWLSGDVPRLVTIDADSVPVCGSVDVDQGFFSSTYTVSYKDANKHQHTVYGAKVVKMDEQPIAVPSIRPYNVSFLTRDNKPYEVGSVYEFTNGAKGTFRGYTVFKPETITTAEGGKWETVPEGRNQKLPDGRIVTDMQWTSIDGPNPICEKPKTGQ